MHNVHERRIAAPAQQVGALLAVLGGPQDRLWPAHDWMPMALDQPVRIGSAGGHADIRYEVSAYEPGRRIELTFVPPTLLTGWHALEVEPLPDGSCVLRHVLVAEPRGSMRLLLPLVVRWIHDAVVEDLLDRAEAAVGVGPVQPTRWSPWVCLLRRLNGMPARRPRVREVPVTSAMEAAGDLPGADFRDAFAVELPPGASQTVADCYDALVRATTPGWLAALIRVRGVLARAMRLETAQWEPGTSPFVLLRQTDEVVVAGAEDRHLDFRAVLQVQERTDGGAELVLVTLVQRHNLAGRLYFGLVKPFHRRVVPSMLRSAAGRVGPGVVASVGSSG